ncbi:MAG: Na+/H+ antiporter NhaC family protein [Bacteroidia bacterium]|nr:Na+/H+ antiporter NhaC family protein [Bacteroidia bacterium]
MQDTTTRQTAKLEFYGGAIAALIPFIVFVSGVIAIALSGAPDEKGFWPILILALGIGLLLAKDKSLFSQKVLEGMSDKMVMIMITAWMLASIIGVLMSLTGFVEALIWMAKGFQLGGIGFVVASFIICCIVSLSTGSSFATILICGPLLYPSGGLLGAHLPSLAGAILAGATFGDFIAPISDTTIASSLSQEAEIGKVVKSRIKYMIPVFILALIAFYISANLGASPNNGLNTELSGSPEALPMLLVPALIIYLFLKGKHLLEGLLMGLLFAVVLALLLGLLKPDQVFSLDLENFGAKSFVIDGINRAVGISFFTILLMGLVGSLKASGLLDNLVRFASSKSNSAAAGERWIAATSTAAVLLTTHSIVAILMLAEFSKESGEKLGISAVRRSNILSMVVCVFPFLLPYFIPVILMANTSNSGQDFGIPAVNALETGLHNFLAWALLFLVLILVLFGWGRKKDELLSK